ncbi:two-component system sensor histidine kinase NtrB [Geotalea uraniireducens]|uniref:histidine kinase n=1 Tax=Geotalea uraniireducens (strain Rf4) TaxID=351605 RepID=A5G4Y5_GEOUR|nr:ATP-binding protein [Geotalea uraniireducens]ABQ26853.1 multi-sensor signal transduction histidine kinase [Geotalea uraniireducens Rf4]
MDEKKRLTWFILLRLVVVSLFLASTTILNVKEPEIVVNEALPVLTRLIVSTYLFSILSLLALKFTDRFKLTLTYLQIVWDLFLVTVLILLTGGINSPFSFLYILAIINASVLLSRREALYTASLCGILYGAIVDLQYFGRLTDIGLSQVAALQYGASHILYTIFINISAFYMTAFLTGYLAERARRSESALKEKVIDYEELERLNSTIVTNLDSGLMTINNSGKIRAFNRYAEELTGVSQRDAYDRPVTDLIPGFSAFGDDIFSLQRQEVEYETPDGNRMIFGFKSVPFTDMEGNRLGAIIDFQDLTVLKRMEEKLKKADRLAAIGELSARIAHEIRNPLASVSGSVQLIAQGGGIAAGDKKLLDIVQRETERLNALITDFLAYARPRRPVKVTMNLKGFMGNLVALLATDSRFERVKILNDCPDDLSVEVDRDQFQQVFWNLLMNAAEAMPAGGTVSIKASAAHKRRHLKGPGGEVRIAVTDNGAGMVPEDVNRIFEPFFTTKTGGTGLGLATVYRIIEAHDGMIAVDSSIGKGTTFTIYLPV